MGRRARIVLLTAEGCGTMELTRRTGTSKTSVWRWQERFMQQGYGGLLHDKTRPSRIPPLGPEVAARVVALIGSIASLAADLWGALADLRREPDGAPYANLNTAAFDGDGDLWFTGQSGFVGKVQAKTGQVSVKQAPRGTGPYGICSTPRYTSGGVTPSAS